MFKRFVTNPTQYPTLIALATGLYPVLFYYTRNFPLINTWKHLGFFMVLFLGVPLVLFWAVRLTLRGEANAKRRLQLATLLNLGFFLNFIQLCLYARLQWWFTLMVVVIAVLGAVFLFFMLKRIVVFQWLLALVTLFWLIPVVQSQLTYSDTWTEQPDDIERANFVHRPNIYVIQPDGYVGFAEMPKGYYQNDNSEFESFLAQQGFTSYPEFRSNYSTTLTSNSSLFSMKHHYYNNGFNFSERMNTREVIISDNAVLRALQHNNYKTHFLAEWPYMLASLPEMGFDASNFDYGELPYLTTGIDEIREVGPYLERFMKEDTLQPKFYFIELFLPGHIATTAQESTGVASEREWWINNLREVNDKLRSLLTHIEANDPEALVVLLSDHGGYVGMEFMRELRTKTNDRDKVFSAFSAMLAVKWPERLPETEVEFKSGVNFFRILFSQLAQEPSYLDHLEDDGSYHLVDRNAPKGVYRYIDGAGQVVFERVK
ncbi:MAG: hypothetical protein AAF466_00930 [Bacteroidota bacterium]